MVVWVGRPYIHDSSPRANMFLARAASLRDSPNSLTASTVIPVRFSGNTWKSPSWSLALTEGLQRVRGVAGLGEVAVVEVVGVHDDRRALGQVGEVRLERRGVHRDQHVGGVARGQDVVVGEVHLERRHAGQGALRRADLGGEVRQRHQVVAERGRLLGEPVSGQLHPVARVAGEPDDDPVDLLDLLGHVLRPFWCTCLVLPAHTVDEACRLAVLGLDWVVRRPSIVPAVCRALEHVPVLSVRGTRRTRPSVVRRARAPHSSLSSDG